MEQFNFTTEDLGVPEDFQLMDPRFSPYKKTVGSLSINDPHDMTDVMSVESPPKDNKDLESRASTVFMDCEVKSAVNDDFESHSNYD